jgi:hypothetical protein
MQFFLMFLGPGAITFLTFPLVVNKLFDPFFEDVEKGVLGLILMKLLLHQLYKICISFIDFQQKQRLS